VPCYQKCTPTDCFFGDFAHWCTPTDCFFGDFAHWVSPYIVYYVHQNSEFTTDTTLQSCDLVSRYHLELYYFGTSCPQNSIAYQKGGFLINSVNYLSFTKIFWHLSPSKLLPIFVNVIFCNFFIPKSDPKF